MDHPPTSQQKTLMEWIWFQKRWEKAVFLHEQIYLKEGHRGAHSSQEKQIHCPQRFMWIHFLVKCNIPELDRQLAQWFFHSAMEQKRGWSAPASTKVCPAMVIFKLFFLYFVNWPQEVATVRLEAGHSREWEEKRIHKERGIGKSIEKNDSCFEICFQMPIFLHLPKIRNFKQVYTYKSTSTSVKRHRIDYHYLLL